MTAAAGTQHIDGLDGYALLDAEAARLERFFDDLPAADWLRPSRCAGWSVRDLLAHLAGGEDYFRACLDDALDGLLAQATAAGATDLHSMTAWPSGNEQTGPPGMSSRSGVAGVRPPGPSYAPAATAR